MTRDEIKIKLAEMGISIGGHWNWPKAGHEMLISMSLPLAESLGLDWRGGEALVVVPVGRGKYEIRKKVFKVNPATRSKSYTYKVIGSGIDFDGWKKWYLVRSDGKEMKVNKSRYSQLRRGGKIQENPPHKSNKFDIEKSPIAPWVAADTIHERAVVYLNNTGHHKEAEKLYAKRNEIADYLANQFIRVYEHNERFRNKVKSGSRKAIDIVHGFMEHWLAGWLKDNAPYILKLLPSGFGWSIRI